MNNDRTIKHHLHWIMRDMGKAKPEEYATFTSPNTPLTEEVCREIDLLVAHIKTNY